MSTNLGKHTYDVYWTGTLMSNLRMHFVTVVIKMSVKVLRKLAFRLLIYQSWVITDTLAAHN